MVVLLPIILLVIVDCPCTNILCTATDYSASVVEMEGSVCGSVENMGAGQQSGGGRVLATAIADSTAVDGLQKKCRG